jgi:probable HAF family extracellular repeat protein
MVVICKPVARASIVGLVGWLAAFPAARVDAQCQYEVTVIQGPYCGEPFGYPVTKGRGMNEVAGLVGWYSCDLVADRAYLWTAASGLTTLPIPPGFSAAEASGANDLGHVVGAVKWAHVDRYLAVRWQDGEVFNLGTLPGGNYSVAAAINACGDIVGREGNNVSGTYPRAFLFRDGVMLGLDPPMGPRSSAEDINEEGQIVGWMGESGLSDSHAFIWQDGFVTDLGVIPGGFSSMARGVNSQGHVVGSGRIPAEGWPLGLTRGFFWDGLEMTVLEPLPGLFLSEATDINAAGLVVGVSAYAQDNMNASEGCIWQGGILTNLNDLIPSEAGLHIKSASAINDAGQISCTADSPSGTVAVLLTPISAPPGDLDGVRGGPRWQRHGERSGLPQSACELELGPDGAQSAAIPGEVAQVTAE